MNLHLHPGVCTGVSPGLNLFTAVTTRLLLFAVALESENNTNIMLYVSFGGIFTNNIIEKRFDVKYFWNV